jgi:hypothetical protein
MVNKMIAIVPPAAHRPMRDERDRRPPQTNKPLTIIN